MRAASGASQKVRRALELSDAALALGTEEAIAAYLACFHSEVDLTAACGGMDVAVSGIGELRTATENLISSGVSYSHRDWRVVSERSDRVVTHYVRVLRKQGAAHLEVEVESEVAFEGDLIRRMAVKERAEPGDRPAPWAPLGSTPSSAGEIVAHWADEKLLVRLRDGRETEVPLPADADGLWDIGDPVIVFFDGAALLGWYLPERQFGVDLRGSGDG